MIRLVVFDLDGTLVDAFKAVEESINVTLGHFGLPLVDIDTIKRTVGWGDRHLVQAFVGPERIDEAIEIYREYHAEALPRSVALLPGARETVEALRALGYRLAIASNRPKQFTRIILDELGMTALFDAVLCGDEVPRPKPYPDILQALMERFGVSPDDTVLVGDMTVDLQTAAAAGARAVALLSGSHRYEDFEPLKPWRILDGVGQLMDLLSGDARGRL